MANINRPCINRLDGGSEDQNGLLSIILRHFHSTLCVYDFAGTELVFNNSHALF